MNEPFPLEEVQAMQQRFAELYGDTTGLVAISHDYVQVRSETLAELADQQDWVCDHESEYYLHFHVVINGTLFVTVVFKEDAAKLGLVKQ